MQEFIEAVAGNLGVGQETAQAATGGLLGLLKENTDADTFGEVMGKLPGAAETMQAAQSADTGGGGGLMGGLGDALGGGLGDALGGMLGGGGGQALGALEALSKSGLDMEKIGSFIEMFKEYVLPKLGPDLLKKLAGSIPGLGDLLG